ncbi:MAG: (2Fe-2S)-binding protein [Acidobacteria bacterium]|nr:(2Fe-2S)-binding protein [Acidobacteriota bacterium]
MSSSNGSTKDNLTKSGFSRRSWLRGAGIGTGVVGTGVLEQEAEAQQAKVMSGEVEISLDINGRKRPVKVEPRTTLLDALRNRLDLTGAKRVCDRATCGACTVIVGGKVVYGCTMLAVDAAGKSIQTIEGIAPEGQLHPVSQAFVNNDAQQCGYCTPGFVMAAKGFLDKNQNPTEAQVDKAMAGNICRCGTYVGVRKAVLEAAKRGGSNA